MSLDSDGVELPSFLLDAIGRTENKENEPVVVATQCETNPSVKWNGLDALVIDAEAMAVSGETMRIEAESYTPTDEILGIISDIAKNEYFIDPVLQKRAQKAPRVRPSRAKAGGSKKPPKKTPVATPKHRPADAVAPVCEPTPEPVRGELSGALADLAVLAPPPESAALPSTPVEDTSAPAGGADLEPQRPKRTKRAPVQRTSLATKAQAYAQRMGESDGAFEASLDANGILPPGEWERVLVGDENSSRVLHKPRWKEPLDRGMIPGTQIPQSLTGCFFDDMSPEKESFVRHVLDSMDDAHRDAGEGREDRVELAYQAMCYHARKTAQEAGEEPVSWEVLQEQRIDVPPRGVARLNMCLGDLLRDSGVEYCLSREALRSKVSANTSEHGRPVWAVQSAAALMRLLWERLYYSDHTYLVSVKAAGEEKTQLEARIAELVAAEQAKEARLREVESQLEEKEKLVSSLFALINNRHHAEEA